MKKIRVLFVMLQLDAGGSERVVYDLVRGLDPARFEIFIAAFKGGVLAEPLEKICREIFYVKKRPGFDLRAMFLLATIIRNHRIDIVNAHHYMPCFYSFLGTRLLNGRGLVYTEHSVPEVENVANSIHGRIFHWMLYRVTAVVGVSRAISERFRERYPGHKVKFHEILNGVDMEKFRPKGERERVRGRWGISGDEFVVGTISNFRKIKNHACLVRAVGRLRDAYPHLRLVLVGTGFPGDPENSEALVRALIGELGIQDRVVLAGYQEKIPEMLSGFDLFCLPSFSEGLPVSMLEAMAAGLPVIGSNVAGNCEVVKHRETGLLFPSDDDGQLALLIEELMSRKEYARRLASNGTKFVDAHHSSMGFRARYSDLFLSKADGIES